MPTLLMSMKAVLARQLLDGGLLVGQAVVAQVAVAVVVVPLAARRRAAAVAHLDDDEAELREPVRVGRRAERLADRLGLRARVDVGDDRVLLLRVEVVRLVHHARQVRHAVVGLHDERLGDTCSPARAAGSRRSPPGRGPGSRGCRAARTSAPGPRGSSCPRTAARDPASAPCGSRCPGSRSFSAAAVEAHAVQVLVVGVLARLAGVRRDVQRPRLLVHAGDVPA